MARAITIIVRRVGLSIVFRGWGGGGLLVGLVGGLFYFE
jgi:hypothetical protein